MDLFRIIIILLLLLGALLQNRINSHNKTKKYFMVLCCFILTFLSAVRANSVGTDTSTYLSEFYTISQNSFAHIRIDNPSCFGYYWLQKIFFELGFDVHIWFFFIALLFNSAVFMFIYRYSKDLNMSLILYVCTGLYTFSVAGLKQTCAMGLCIFSFLLWNSEVKKFRKFIFSILLILVGSLFHQSALFFIIVLIISKLKLSRKNNIIFIIIFGLVLCFGSNWLKSFIIYLNYIGNRFGYYIDNVSNYSLTMFFIQFLIILVCIIFYNNLKKGKLASSLYSLVIADLFYYITIFVSSMFRMGYYLAFLNFALYPNVLVAIKDQKLRNILLISSKVIFILYFLIFSYFSYATMWGT